MYIKTALARVGSSDISIAVMSKILTNKLDFNKKKIVIN